MPFRRDKYTAVILSVSFAFAVAATWADAQNKPAIPTQQALTSRLVVISVNGLSSDHILRPERYRHRVPNLIALRDRGSYAAAVEGVYPSLTLPAHATISTGMLPVDHGIFSDHRFDIESGVVAETPFSEARQILVDTIWEATRRAGLTSASADFPLTQSAAIDSRFKISEGLGPVIELIEKKRVNLLLMNFTSFADAQLRYGVNSKEALAALEGIDVKIGQVTGASGTESTLIIASDSSRASVEREFRPNVILAKKGFLTVDGQGGINSWRAICQVSGGSAAVFIKNGQDEKVVAEVEKAFREIHEKPESPIWRIINRQEAARLGADPRAALFLDAAPLYAMSSKANGASTGASGVRAISGYLPQRAEMRAALLIAGRGVKAGVRLEFARLVDIAPTISRLLGVELRTSRGRVLNEVLVQ